MATWYVKSEKLRLEPAFYGKLVYKIRKNCSWSLCFMATWYVKSEKLQLEPVFYGDLVYIIRQIAVGACVLLRLRI